MKKAAILGFGTIAPIHLAAIMANPAIDLVAICDNDAKALEKAPAGVALFSSCEEMYEAVKPDVVHVCLPHYLHYPVSKWFAERGVHVFCEKPVGLTQEQAAEFVALEAAHPELKLGICLQNRLNETTEALKAIIDGGEYGRVLGCRGFVPWFRGKEYYDEQPWRGIMQYAGGGSMINQSVHTLDLLYYLVGHIDRLQATVSRISGLDIEVEDTVAARLEFAGGAKGIFIATNCNYANESVQIRIQLEKATFLIEDDCLWKIEADNTRTKLVENCKMPGKKFYFGASHGKLIDRFYRAVEEDGSDYIHVSDAEMTMKLIDGIVASSQVGCAVEIK